MTKKILVIGASGYVGSRLVPLLMDKGYQVIAAGRSLEHLKGRHWSQDPRVQLQEVDLLNGESVRKVVKDCEIVYYLIHSMNSVDKDFAQSDRLAAHNMVNAVENSSVKRVIYLGGLGNEEGDLSEHLRSRSEVGEILSHGNVPVTIFRAAMIIGAASISFEILRYLNKRLPIMITPKWVSTKSQPIAIRNVLVYLAECLDYPETMGRKYDIGGPDILTYRCLFDIFCQEAGLKKRFILAVPFLTPSLSSLWVSLVTPISSKLARPLVEGLRNEVICQNTEIHSIITQKLLTCREAIHAAISPVSVERDQLGNTVYCPEHKCPGDPFWVP